MQLSFASYNIRKAIGVDRRRDPDRILRILQEIDADVIALQEADRRFGRRRSALPHSAILENTHYRPIHLPTMQDGIGWHGNALLVRCGIAVLDAAIVPLPAIEPRGAVRADLDVAGNHLRVVGLHLDLSGLRRRQQIRNILFHLSQCNAPLPTVLMGDFNEWARCGGCFREFGEEWQVLSPGRSYPSRRPVAGLDRIVASSHWHLVDARVHHSALAARGSDHLPIVATLRLPNL
ncbi:MAG: endonuclease/exonuclease/phosphatase family protein [Novosphingobium sp.]|nr:endonuclease/exonuclease/phosphatase family protein [Novosphingobium sp.]